MRKLAAIAVIAGLVLASTAFAASTTPLESVQKAKASVTTAEASLTQANLALEQAETSLKEKPKEEEKEKPKEEEKPGTRTLSATPLGAPGTDWKVVFGDAFNYTSFPSSIWSLTRDEGQQLNSDEIAAFSKTQDTLTSAGAVITAKYIGGSGKDKVLSGILTAPNFVYHFGDGGPWAFQMVTQLPPNTHETDIGLMWSNGPPYTGEVDHPELGGWGSYNNSSGWLGAAIYFGQVGSSADSFNKPLNVMGIEPATGTHTWTAYMDGSNHWSLYLDGKPVPGCQNVSSSPNTSAQLKLILSYGMREPSGGSSGDVGGERHWTIDSVAVYRPTAYDTKSFTGGGLAPGTNIN
jgi:hypothetical protein